MKNIVEGTDEHSLKYAIQHDTFTQTRSKILSNILQPQSLTLN